MKEILKKIIKLSPIPLSKNHLYDIQTQKIFKKVLRENSNCVDVGAHKGEILEIMQKYASKGKYFAFEPIPALYEKLKEKYQALSNCEVYNVALSESKGTAMFNYVVSNPSYSGLKKRAYDRPNEKDTQIEVQTERLSDLINSDLCVDLIKIDVEGGELQVLKGAQELITRCKPVVIFEHGLGASEFYDTTPDKIYKFFEQCGLKIYTLGAFLKGDASLTLEDLTHQYTERLNYYFVAANQ